MTLYLDVNLNLLHYTPLKYYTLYSTLCSWKHHNTYAQFERTILHQHLQRFTVIWAIGPDIYRCIRSNHNRLGIYTEIQFIFWHSIVVFLCSVMLLDLVEFWVNSSPCARETLLSQCGRCESAKFSRDRTDCSLCN